MIAGISRAMAIRLGLTCLGILALGLMVWFVGPLIAVADAKPLDGVGVRLVLIVLIAAGFCAPLVLDAIKRRRAARELLSGISQNADRTSAENQKIADSFEKALATLNSTGSGKGASRLYELPWYMFIGAPGSGKTSALVNSGLKFPLSAGSGASAIRGIGGTRHCDWWFSEEAVLIDTAGRFSTQDSDATLDATAWKTFLALLRKNRPSQPVNGILLTISVEELHQGLAQRQQLAERLRARMQEIIAELQVTPPVYLFITKADLIAGFTASFDGLSQEARQQGWGFTFESATPGNAGLMQAFSQEFDQLRQRLHSQLLGRLENETDPGNRVAMFGFPDQFGELKGPLGQMLEMIFPADSGVERPTWLRGVYLTSGTQQGTPLDRILGSMGQLAQRAFTSNGTGKSYFIGGVLRDVVFRERQLVGFNPAVARRQRMLMVGSLALSLALAVGLVGLWAVSYSRNQAYVSDVQARTPVVKQTLTQVPVLITGDVLPVLPALDALAALPLPTDFDAQSPGLTRTAGLSQLGMLQTGGDISYYRALEQGLMPRVAKRIEERLRAVNTSNLELAYEALKHYLMLYSPQHFNADSVQAWVEIDWDTQYQGSLSAEQRAALSGHLRRMLERGAPQPQVAMDAALVERVRTMIASYPVEQRIFSRLAKSRLSDQAPDVTVAGIAGPFAAQVLQRASGKPLSTGIPGLFTVDGYYKGFRKGIEAVSAQLLVEEPWVLGKAAGAGRSAASDLAITDRVKTLYLLEYIRQWDALLADVRLIKPNGLEAVMQQARILSTGDSPLRLFLSVVDRQTRLAAGAPALARKADQQADAAKAALANLAGGADPTGGGAKLAESQVDSHFASLHRLFDGQPPEINQMQTLFNDMFMHLSAVDAAKKSKGAPPPPEALEKIKTAASLLPGPVGGAVGTLAETGGAQSRVAERQNLSGELQPLTQFCSRAISGRYPFSSTAKADVLPEDFGQFFGQGGLMDEFFQKRLQSLVDTAGATWVFKPLPDGSRPAGGDGLADFQRAARIRDVFFRSGGRAPAFRIEIRLVEASDANSQIVLDLDGTALKFAPGNNTSQVVQWPPVKIASQLKVQVQPNGTPVLHEGPWALFRMLDKATVTPGASPDRFGFTLAQDGKTFRFEGFSTTVFNPFRLREIQQFRCPTTL